MLFRLIIEPYLTWFRLFRASWHSASVSIISPCMIIFVGILVGRGLGATDLGNFGAISAFFGWFSVLMGYPIYAKLPVLLAEHRHNPAHTARIATTVLVLWSLLTLVGIIPAIIWLPYRLHELKLDYLYWAILLYVGCIILSQYKVIIDIFMTYAGWMKRWSISALAGSLVPAAILGVLLLVQGRFSIYQYLLYSLYANIIMLAVTALVFLNALGGWRSLRPDFRLVKPLIMAGFGPGLAALISILFNSGVPTLIANHLPSRELGYYNVALTLYIYIISIGMSIAVPATAEWSHLATERRFEELRHDLHRRQLATGVMLTTVAVLCYIFAEPLLVFLFGNEYRAAVPVFRLSMPIFVTAGFGNWYPTALYAMGHTQRISLPYIVYVLPTYIATYIILNYTHFGILGVQVATTVGNVIWLLLFARMFYQGLRQEMRKDAAKETSHVAVESE